MEAGPDLDEKGQSAKSCMFLAHQSELGYKFTAIDRWPRARQRGAD